MLTEAMSIARGATNGLSPGGASLIGTYGALLQFENRAEDGLPYVNEALKYVIALGTNRTWIRGWMMKTAEVTEHAERWQEAEALQRELLRRCEDDIGPEAPMTLQAQFGLARTLVKEKQWQEALPMLERVISLNQLRFGSNNYSSLIPQFWLGQAYEQKGDGERATSFY